MIRAQVKHYCAIASPSHNHIVGRPAKISSSDTAIGRKPLYTERTQTLPQPSPTYSKVVDGGFDEITYWRDSRLRQHTNRNSKELAEEPEDRITAQNLAEWERGSVLEWANEAHQLARTVVYGNLNADDPRTDHRCIRASGGPGDRGLVEWSA